MERFYQNEELREVRANVNWAKLISALGLTIDDKRSNQKNIYVHSPFSITGDKTASLHIEPDSRRWYCFASNQNGGAIELVQKIYQLRLSDACQWLISHGVSYLGSSDAEKLGSEKKKKPGLPLAFFGEAPNPSQPSRTINKTVKIQNMPTRFDLIPYLTRQGTHPEFIKRGISAKTCHYLGCGHLENSKSFLKQRIIFQVRSVHQSQNSVLIPVVLTHIGRATTPQQETTHGKWCHYSGFTKTLEIYNLDKVLLDKQARSQAQETGSICIVEGCFDLAKLIEANILNVVATFGSHLDPGQLPRFQLLAKELGITHFNLFYDRDLAGTIGKTKAQHVLENTGDYTTSSFNWNQTFPNGKTIPIALTDPCALSTRQLRWLRKVGKI